MPSGHKTHRAPRARETDGKTKRKRDQNRENGPHVRRNRVTTEMNTEGEEEMMFEFIAEPGIIVARAQATTTTELLELVSVALGKLAHAYDYGHNGEVAQARERWALITSGAVAALEDPAEYYRRTGETPERAAVLGERVRLAMRHSK